MQNYRSLKHPLVLFASLVVLAGCGGSSGKSVNADMDSRPSGPTMDDYKAELHEIVRDDIESARRKADKSAADVYNYKPYYYKSFEDYPNGTEDFSIEFVELDSRTTPLAAEVKVPKLRFSTQIQRDRDAVRSDMDFQRESGVETISYELRNGRWYRVATLFVASELSTLMGGEWVPREEEPRPAYEMQEDESGFFRRTWERMRIGDGPDTHNP